MGAEETLEDLEVDALDKMDVLETMIEALEETLAVLPEAVLNKVVLIEESNPFDVFV